MNRHIKKLRFTSIAMLFSYLFSGAYAAPAEDWLTIVTQTEKTFVGYRVNAQGEKQGFAAPSLKMPLGSLWKVFVYVYLYDEKLRTSPYVCSGKHLDDVFCCKPGQSITRDQALVKSCGRFFSFSRLKIDARIWESYWRKRINQTFPWLYRRHQLKPETRVSVVELLTVLDQLKSDSHLQSKLNVLLGRVVTAGTAQGVLGKLGSRIKFKTFTWNDPHQQHAFIGGFAGWLNDGTMLWVSGSGKSHAVIARWAEAIMKLASTHMATSNDRRQCVQIQFFDRYPIKEIREVANGKQAHDGPLYGQFEVTFENSRKLIFEAQGNLRYDIQKHRLVGNVKLDDYIARVIDREVNAGAIEAAKAFAVLIRTYLYQNAKKRDSCLTIKDSTRYQRVSVNPPSQKALAIVRWTTDLILTNVPDLRYHSHRNAKNRLSWQRAKKLAAEGALYDMILRQGYPGGRVDFLDVRDNRICVENKAAQTWLSTNTKVWHRHLITVNGYEKPRDVQVCLVDHGAPYADGKRMQIYLKWGRSMQDKVTLAHEYIHLAFRHHPRGQDEKFADHLAKSLVLRMGVRDGM